LHLDKEGSDVELDGTGHPHRRPIIPYDSGKTVVRAATSCVRGRINRTVEDPMLRLRIICRSSLTLHPAVKFRARNAGDLPSDQVAHALPEFTTIECLGSVGERGFEPLIG
jgi:hypothetical protein